MVESSSASSAVEPASGQLGRYRLLAKIARGGMSDVFLARAEGGGLGLTKVVVIKRMRAEPGEQEEAFRTMFYDEARLSMQLNHANIVPTFEIGEDDGAIFMVMEYAEGHTLQQLRRALRKRGRKLPAAMATRIVYEVLAGLHYAHELRDVSGAPLNIVHRDVTPQNIVLGYDGRVRLLDFGVAKANMRSTQTRIGIVKGKPRYMSPEQFFVSRDQDVVVDRRSDVFSLGVVLWELLTERSLFPDDEADLKIFVSLVNLDVPIDRVSVHDPSVDPLLDEIVAKALAKRPADRFENALDMKRTLEAYVAARGESTSTEQIGDLVTELFRDRREELADRIRGAIATPSIIPGDSGVHSVPTVADGGSAQLGAAAAPGETLKSTGQEPKRSRRAGVPLFMAIGVMVVALFLFLRLHDEPPPAPVPDGKIADVPTPQTATSVAVRPALPATTTASATETASAPREAATSREVRDTPVSPPAHVARGAWPPPHKSPPTKPADPPSSPSSASQSNAATPSNANATGFLTIDTLPWSRVSLNGRVLGDTPLVQASLPVGTHTLTLDNPDENIHQTTQVTIRAGETTARRLAF